MKSGNIFARGTLMRRFVLITVVAIPMLVLYLISMPTAAKAQDVCKSSSKNTRNSCWLEARADYLLSLAGCDNLSTPEAGQACREEAEEEFRATFEECREQYAARLEICDALGAAPYDPQINPDDFMDIDEIIDNPNTYFPLVPGTLKVFEGDTEEGTEVIEVSVTDDTREILGVDCVVVRDTVTLDGELTEDTFDYFAQDNEGNVWYFGENSYTYEDGIIVGVEGSWIAGVDGAKPGILMEANPQVGDIYRQEFFLAEAEDMGEVLALDQAVTVPYGSFQNCVMTKDFTPIEPDVEEHKYYAPGVGVVLEVDVEAGERTELVDITTP